MNRLFAVAGPPGIGKTTSCGIAADMLEKSAFIDGDTVYYFVRNGLVKPWLPGNQMKLFWKNVYAIIRNLLDDGFDVFFTYVISPGEFDALAEAFPEAEKHFCVLVADEETVMARDKLRPVDCRLNERCLTLLRKIKGEQYAALHNYFIDSSRQTAEETASAIINSKPV